MRLVLWSAGRHERINVFACFFQTHPGGGTKHAVCHVGKLLCREICRAGRSFGLRRLCRRPISGDGDLADAFSYRLAYFVFGGDRRKSDLRRMLLLVGHDVACGVRRENLRCVRPLGNLVGHFGLYELLTDLVFMQDCDTHNLERHLPVGVLNLHWIAGQRCGRERRCKVVIAWAKILDLK